MVNEIDSIFSTLFPLQESNVEHIEHGFNDLKAILNVGSTCKQRNFGRWDIWLKRMGNDKIECCNRLVHRRFLRVA